MLQNHATEWLSTQQLLNNKIKQLTLEPFKVRGVTEVGNTSGTQNRPGLSILPRAMALSVRVGWPAFLPPSFYPFQLTL
jgi:hypothetical protein